MGDRSPEGARKSIQGIQNLLRGRALEYALSCHLIVRKSDEAARQSLQALLGENQSSFDTIVHHGLIGAPATIAQKLREYEEAGINYILLKPAPTLEGLEALGEEVLPHLRK